jgi:hypothetical protein
MVRMQIVRVAVLLAAVAGCFGAAALPSAAVAAEKCNGKTKPCPFQQFMRDNAGTPMASGDLSTIAKTMDKIEKAGGPDMKDWAKLAKKTAQDARDYKTDDVKADCKACHDAYKSAYIKDVTLRNKPFP